MQIAKGDMAARANHQPAGREGGKGGVSVTAASRWKQPHRTKWLRHCAAELITKQGGMAAVTARIPSCRPAPVALLIFWPMAFCRISPSPCSLQIWTNQSLHELTFHKKAEKPHFTLTFHFFFLLANPLYYICFIFCQPLFHHLPYYFSLVILLK